MKAGWWGAPLSLRVLAVNTVNFPHSEIVSWCHLHTTLWSHSRIVSSHQFCGNKGEYIWLLRGIKQRLLQWDFDVTPTITNVIKFQWFSDATTTGQDWPWTYSSFQSLHMPGAPVCPELQCFYDSLSLYIKQEIDIMYDNCFCWEWILWAISTFIWSCLQILPVVR